MSIIIRHQNEIGQRLNVATGKILETLTHGTAEIIIKNLTKRRGQEEKYHAMIADFVRHGSMKYLSTVVDFKSYDDPLEVAKALLITWYEAELLSVGDKLRSPSRCVIDPLSGHAVQLRASSKKFTIKEAAGFIEFLSCTAAEVGVKFSERVKCFDDYPEMSRA